MTPWPLALTPDTSWGFCTAPPDRYKYDALQPSHLQSAECRTECSESTPDRKQAEHAGAQCALQENSPVSWNLEFRAWKLFWSCSHISPRARPPAARTRDLYSALCYKEILCLCGTMGTYGWILVDCSVLGDIYIYIYMTVETMCISFQMMLCVFVWESSFHLFTFAIEYFYWLTWRVNRCGCWDYP